MAARAPACAGLLAAATFAPPNFIFRPVLRCCCVVGAADAAGAEPAAAAALACGGCAAGELSCAAPFETTAL